jgi:sugar phosphate isomerase/epimerase
MTTDTGLTVSSYGSYYVVCGKSSPSFESVVDTAAELGAPGIRVWAGDKGSEDADESYWETFVFESRKLGEAAAKCGLTVSFEFHRNSLTDTNESAIRLLKAIDHPSIKTYWQPPVGRDSEYSLDGLNALLPWLVNAHVYKLRPDCASLPLEAGAEEWKIYFKAMKASGRDHFAHLEFVRDDDPKSFIEDAAVLKGLVC